MNIEEIRGKAQIWLSDDGSFLWDGQSHYHLARKYIEETTDTSPAELCGEDDLWDYCYNHMFKEGFARIYISSFAVYVHTDNLNPDKVKLLNLAKKLGKELGKSEVICDQTDRVLWSKENTI